jgi:pimeloyl-ACP methyl ester carboxylesterase
MGRPRIIFFPGLGTDERLLGPQRSLPGDIEVPPWIAPLSERESLANYAKRLAATLDTSTPFYLGGISFGGFIAQEVARHVRAKRLFLLSSCTSRHGIPHAYRLAGDVLLPYLVPAILNPLKALPSYVRSFGPSHLLPGNKLVQEMVRDCTPELFRWSIAALLEWDGHADDVGPVVHIKGDHDIVLPHYLCRPTHLIPGAGHLMNITHAPRVNEIIAGFL